MRFYKWTLFKRNVTWRALWGVILCHLRDHLWIPSGGEGKQNKASILAAGGLDLLSFKLTLRYRRIFLYNICLISISDTVSDGTTKTLVLNIERAQHDNLSQGIWSRCIEYFLCGVGLKLKILQRMYVWAHGRFCHPEIFQRTLHPKNQYLL